MQGKKSKAKSNAQIEKVLDSFVKGATEGRFGRYIIDGNRLVYRVATTEEFRITRQNKEAFIKHIESGNIAPIDKTLDEIRGAEIAHSLLIKSRILLEEEVAKRLNQDGRTLYVGNEATLKLIGRKVSFGRVRNNRESTVIQYVMDSMMPMIDFAFFNGTGDLREQVEGWKHIMKQEPGCIKNDEMMA
jgi:hypothetical protein